LNKHSTTEVVYIVGFALDRYDLSKLKNIMLLPIMGRHWYHPFRLHGALCRQIDKGLATITAGLAFLKSRCTRFQYHVGREAPEARPQVRSSAGCPGFRELVRGDADGERIDHYLEALRDAIGETDVKSAVFSDTIVLTVESDTEEAFLLPAKACSRSMGALLSRGIALRGAISFGKF
jgi:hypothetical protein